MSKFRFRPLGGVKGVTMGASLNAGGAPSPPSLTQIVALVDDSSSYSEQVEVVDGVMRVTHTLKLMTTADYDLMDCSMAENFAQMSFIARIELNCGYMFTLGVSPRAGFDRPLRLTSSRFASGDSPTTHPYREWCFTMVDGTPRI